MAACALLCAGGALAATYDLRGNAKGMRLAERVMHAFARIPGYTFRENNFFQIISKGGKKPSLKYAFGFGTLQAGWTWASEKGAMGLSNNDVVWWRDDLTPANSKRAQPVELVFKGGKGYWRFRSASCFRTLSSSAEMPNDRGFVVTGKVSAPKGNTLSYSYRWGSGRVKPTRPTWSQAQATWSRRAASRSGATASASTTASGGSGAPPA